MLLYNATIINESESYHGYVEVKGNIIENVAKGDPIATLLNSYPESERLDLDGKWLLPGVIDDQVHFRDPGLTHKGDIATESRAAIAGGVTSFMDMPNTKPQTTTLEAWKAKMQHAQEVSLANYSFFFGATNDNIAEINKLDSKAIPGIKVFLGASTGNMLVDNEASLDKIFSLPYLIAIHSEDENIIRKNAETYREKYGEDVPVECHPLIRSREACLVSTQRAIERAQRLGTRLHILHLSTKEEILLLGDTNSSKITGEVCVHHLWFTDEQYKSLGTRIKCNPAVKSREDREELRHALNDGRIAVIATDHAPHLLSEKEGGALKAASGMPLVQFSLLAMLDMAKQGITSTENVVRLMCHNPATLYDIDRRGFIRKGYYADMVVVDPSKPTEVTTEIIQSRCGWSPFEGHTFPHSVDTTIVNGVVVYTQGKFSGDTASMPLRFHID